jgi:NADPH-dependent glutamate synthase beta subunit-like oxidoreductase
MRLGDEERGGVRLPVPIAGSEFTVTTQTLIMAVGHQADLSSLPPEVSCAPSAPAAGLPGVFAGGEFVQGPGTLAESMAAGKRAAFAIKKYLKTGECSMESQRRPPWVKEEGPVDLLAHRPRVSPDLPPVSERLAGFKEVERNLTMEQLQQELDRCLQCDRYRWQGLMKG